MTKRLEHYLHFFKLKNVIVSVTNLALRSLTPQLHYKINIPFAEGQAI